MKDKWKILSAAYTNKRLSWIDLDRMKVITNSNFDLHGGIKKQRKWYICEHIWNHNDKNVLWNLKKIKQVKKKTLPGNTI